MAKKRTKKVPLGKPILWSKLPEAEQIELATPDEADQELARSRVVRRLRPFMDAELREAV